MVFEAYSPAGRLKKILNSPDKHSYEEMLNLAVEVDMQTLGLDKDIDIKLWVELVLRRLKGEKHSVSASEFANKHNYTEKQAQDAINRFKSKGLPVD